VLNSTNAAEILPSGNEHITFIDWENTELQKQYLSAIDSFLALTAGIPSVRERIRYFSIGNEVDLYFGALAQYFPEKAKESKAKFVNFCRDVAPQVKTKLPNAKVGVCCTVDGIVADVWTWINLNKKSDVLIATFYAKTSDFQQKIPEKYKQDFQFVLNASQVDGKPLVLQEVAMPTPQQFDLESASKLSLKQLWLNNELKAQADFLEYLFQEWQKVGGQIRFLSWWPLFDYFYDPELAVTLANSADPLSEIQVKAGPTGPQDWTKGNPLWAWGNQLALFFFGPFRPDKKASEQSVQTNADRVYFLQQSVGSGKYASFCRFLSSCGLLRADGTPKPVSARFRDLAKELRVQMAP